jgi:hypothetical protein
MVKLRSNDMGHADYNYFHIILTSKYLNFMTLTE